MTHEIDELSEFKTNSLHKIKQLQETSTDYQRKLSQKENKILRMQQSFSWKITGPLRFLRRKKEKLFQLTKRIHSPACIKADPSPTKLTISEKPIQPYSPFEFENVYSDPNR